MKQNIDYDLLMKKRVEFIKKNNLDSNIITHETIDNFINSILELRGENNKKIIINSDAKDLIIKYINDKLDILLNLLSLDLNNKTEKKNVNISVNSMPNKIVLNHNKYYRRQRPLSSFINYSIPKNDHIVKTEFDKALTLKFSRERDILLNIINK